jgi:Myb-like DNA-binding protein BAS1
LDEDALIRAQVERLGPQWKLIGQDIPWRTPDQIRLRFTQTLDPGIKKGAWTEKEDKKLLELYAIMGNTWAEIARQLARPHNQIRNRFIRLIDRGDVIPEWTDDEDLVLRQMFEKVGRSWDEIAAELPGKTANEIRSRWDILQSQVVDYSGAE